MNAREAIYLAASEELRPLLEKPWLPKKEREAAEMRAKSLLEALQHPRRMNSKFIRDRLAKVLAKNN